MRQPFKLKIQVILLVFVLILFSSFVSSEVQVNYFRGDSLKETVDSVEYYSISTLPPIDSTTTTISVTTTQGINELETWFTPEMPFEFVGQGSVWAYFSSISITNDTGKLSFNLYDYNPSNQSTELIAQSDWFDIPTIESAIELPAELVNTVIEQNHRIKLVLNYDANVGNGTITLVLDEIATGETLNYFSSNGNNYSLENVRNSGFGIINIIDICSIECSSDSVCDDGDELTRDYCNNPGLCISYCESSLIGIPEPDPDPIIPDSNSTNPDQNLTIPDSNIIYDPETCEISCSSDSVCDDGLEISADSCKNLGTCESYCENTSCEITCNNNADCDDGNPLTNDRCVNPGSCTASCSSNSCNPICSSNADCDDSDLATLDVCAGVGRCSATCEHLLNVGNEVCDSDETKCSAPIDCGACAGNVSEFQEYGCIGNICKTLLKLNVCGNTICEKGENFSNCLNDCEPRVFSIATAFLDNFYVNGEKVLVKVKLIVDGIEIKTAKVRASGFFGKIPLYNDGKHGDETRNDNIFGNYFTIPNETEEKLYPITFSVELLGVESKKVVFINVVPKLSFLINLNKSIYILGDNLAVTGKINLKGTPVNLPIDINFMFGKERISQADVNSESGNFTANHRTTLIDESGTYSIIISAKDTNGNMGLFEKEIEVLDSESTSFLFVDVNTIGELKKGSKAKVWAQVKSIDNKIVTGATVNGETKTGEIFNFIEEEEGKYYGEFVISNVLDSSKVILTVVAKKQAKQGSKKISFDVNSTNVLIELISPKESNFLVGEEISIKINASYENGEPVVSETIFATVNNETITLKGTEKGVYQGNYIVKLEDEGVVVIKINLDDGFNNTAEELIEIEVSGISYLYYLRTYGVSLLLIIFALSITIIFLYINIKKLTGINSLKKKEARIIETIKALQTEYFVEGTLDKKNYDINMEKYESQLQDIQESIKQKTAKGEK